MGKIELAMMKFLILALALSTIATQANPVPQEFDETDDVSEIHDPAGYKQPENAQAAVNGANVHTHHSKTCNEPCPTFWANSHAECAEGAEYKACTGLAWHTCVVANGGNHATYDYKHSHGTLCLAHCTWRVPLSSNRCIFQSCTCRHRQGMCYLQRRSIRACSHRLRDFPHLRPRMCARPARYMLCIRLPQRTWRATSPRRWGTVRCKSWSGGCGRWHH